MIFFIKYIKTHKQYLYILTINNFSIYLYIFDIYIRCYLIFSFTKYYN